MVRRACLAKTLGVSVVWVVAFTAGAQEYGPTLDYSLGFRAQYDDNVLLLPEDAQADVLIAPFAQFGIDRQGSRVDAAVSGFVEYVTYDDDTFISEFRGNLSTTVQWRLIENRFNWVFEDSLDRSPINILDRDTPVNQQHTNAFSTGPDVFFRLSAADQVRIGARFNDFYADVLSDANSDGTSLSAQWTHSLSEVRNFGLSASSTTIDFDNQNGVINDYDLNQASLFYSDQFGLGGGRLSLNAAAGYSEAEFEQGAQDSIDTPFFNLSLVGETTRFGDYSITLTRQIGNIFSDTAVQQIGATTSLISQTAVVGEPFIRESASLSWNRDFSDRLQLTSGITVDQVEYDSGLLNQDLASLVFGGSYRFRPLIRLDGEVRLVEQDFPGSQQENDFFDFTVGVRYQRTRRLSFQLRYSYSTNDSNVAALEHDRRIIGFEATYRR